MSSGGNRTWRRTLALWAAVVAVCAGVAGISWAVEDGRRRAVAEQRRRRALAGEMFDVVAALRGQTLDELESRLNGGRPMTRLPGSGELKARVGVPGEALDPRFKGWTVRLTFLRLPAAPLLAPGFSAPVREHETIFHAPALAAGGEIGPRHYLCSFSAAPPPDHSGPSAQTLFQAARLRGAALVFGAVGWAIALLTLHFARRWRREVAQVMLACVLVAAVGWAAEPSRQWAVAELTGTLPLLLALTALLSLGLILPPVRSMRSATRRCQNCKYDLTGNVSGVCPECGHPTPRGKVERWRGLAERIEHVGEREEDDEIVMPPAEFA